MVGAQAAADATVRKVRDLNVGVAVTSLALSPDGKKLAALTMARPDVQVWDIERGKLLWTLRRSRDRWLGSLTQDLLFTPDGRHLVAVDSADLKPGSPAEDQDKDHARWLYARAWDMKSGEEVGQITGTYSARFGGHVGLCWLAALDALVVVNQRKIAWHKLPDGQLTNFLVTDRPLDDKALRYDIHTASCHPNLPQVAVSPLGEPRPPSTRLQRTSASVEPILVFDLAARKRVASIGMYPTDTIVMYDATGAALISLPINGHQPADKAPGTVYSEPVGVWSTKTLDRINVVEPPLVSYGKSGAIAYASLSWPRAVANFPGFFAYRGGQVQLWNHQTNAAVASVPVSNISAVAVSADGKWLAIGNGSNARVFRVRLDNEKANTR